MSTSITSLGIMILPVFFFNDTATTEIYTLSLHDALPISPVDGWSKKHGPRWRSGHVHARDIAGCRRALRSSRRSEEHTSELQSRLHLVCRLLLEKKKHLDCSVSY